MATKYSPGPWVAVPNDNERGGDGKWLVCNARKPGEPADQWGVCTVWHQSGGEINGHEDEANAKLIAAAPEMADALRNTLKYYAATQPGRNCLIDELNPCGGIKHWGIGDGCPLCSARAALAKVGL